MTSGAALRSPEGKHEILLLRFEDLRQSRFQPRAQRYESSDPRSTALGLPSLLPGQIIAVKSADEAFATAHP